MLEFALVAPLLLLLLAGVLDFSMLLRTAACAADAARAGTEYGSKSATAAADTAGMQAAALDAAPGVTGMTATATRSCKCSDGSAVSCGGTCASGKMMIYVRVTTHIPNAGGVLKPKMTGYAKIMVAHRPVWDVLFRPLLRWVRIELWSWLP